MSKTLIYLKDLLIVFCMVSSVLFAISMLFMTAFGQALPLPAQGADEDDEWYGTGYRDPEWILERGGTIIKYRIKGEENSSRYKARLYQGNDMVEIEYGGRAYFDDAINNLYKIIVFEGTKKIIDTDVTARPGQEITVKFDIEDDEVEIETEQVVPFSEIKLNSRSSRYVTPADLGRVPVPAPMSQVREDDEFEESEEIQETSSKEEGAVEEEVEEPDPLSQAIASFETTFAALEAEIPVQLSALESRRGIKYIVFGPDREALDEVMAGLQEGEESLDELTHLAETTEGELRTMLEEKIANAENFLAAETLRVEARRLNFWERLRNIF